MALLQLRKDEDPILRKKSKVVTRFDEGLKTLIDDMIETMHEEQGVGLAAVQVGKLRRVLTYDQYLEEGEPGYMINPEILSQEGEACGVEGCLSVSNTLGKVMRPTKLLVRYQNLEGEVLEMEAEDHLARILCHEIDHLEGILFTDKMTEEVFLDDETEEN